MKQCNMTWEYLAIHEIPLHEGGWLTFRRLIEIVASVFGLTSVVISIILIFLHATHYSKASQQKHIIRILTMPAVYSLFSWFSFKFYRYAIYLQLIPLCYEAITICSFFLLLCNFLAPDLASQHEFFSRRRPQKWKIFKVCGVRRPPSGLTWFRIICVLILQYVVFRPLMGLIGVITQAAKVYCNESLSPSFFHLWYVIFCCITVAIAMNGLIIFYGEMRHDLAYHKPGAKFIAIKLVVFFTFFQNIVINIIASHKHSTPKLAVQDLKIGLPALLTCVEMALFATLHIYTYSHKPYCIGKTAYEGGTLGWRALLDAYNPLDLLVILGGGIQWLFTGRKQTEWHSHASIDSTDNSRPEHVLESNKEGVRLNVEH